MPSPAIEAIDLVKRFGDFTAVDHVSFEVPEGTVFGLLGPNGAGKTTAVRMMTTLTTPTSGTARVAGHDVRTDPDAVRACMGLTAQGATVDELLTGRENLRLIGELYGLDRAHVRRSGDELLERFSLTDAGTKVVKEYSGGMRRRLDLAVSLIAVPPVLFLDEPTTGLDPRSRVELWDVLRDLVREGTTLLLTTQYLDEADQLADRIVVVDHGRIIEAGTPLELKNRSGRASLVVTVSRAELFDEAEALVRAEIPEVHADRAARHLSAPAEGVGSLTRIAGRLEAAGIELDDIGLQRPSLDDVFLHLTGHRAEDQNAAPSGEGAAGPEPDTTAASAGLEREMIS
jgi:ABC-2 type transport system ATP-binding protein